MMLSLPQYVLGMGSGSLVGLALGLFGGGGSILAVPLMVYIVGVSDPHVAIGTSALAVAANASANLITHARQGNVKWRCAATYSIAGVCGAYAGSSLGKMFDGQKLLALFAVLIVVVGALMFRARGQEGNYDAQCTRQNAPKILGFGALTGLFSGFFGIGGGFLIVPGLVASTGMPILNAIGSSLVAVTAFGVTTASNYARSGYVDWRLALIFVGGGVIGGFGGAYLARHLAQKKGALNLAFASLIMVVAIYMFWKSAAAFTA